eukprot:1179984-Prorocentrum_minimum.AAC.7
MNYRIGELRGGLMLKLIGSLPSSMSLRVATVWILISALCFDKNSRTVVLRMPSQNIGVTLDTVPFRKQSGHMPLESGRVPGALLLLPEVESPPNSALWWNPRQAVAQGPSCGVEAVLPR